MNWFRVVRHLTFSAFRSLRSSWGMHTVTAVTLATTFFVMVGSYLLFKNLRTFIAGSDGGPHVSVYFHRGGDKTSRPALDKTFCKRPFVERCEFISTEDARRRFLRSNPGLEQAVASLEENPFPASMEIRLVNTLRDREALRAFSSQIGKLPGIEGVDDGGEWADRWLTFLRLGDWAMWVLGTALGLATVFIVANTIKLVVYARRDEVEIMSLVGASDAMVRFPFLLEGAIQGILGVAIALTLLHGLFFYSQRVVEQQWGLFGSVGLVGLSWPEHAIAIGLGILLGVVGSAVAVGRHLR